ncbi:hypothetical protein EDB19DRAFT_1840717, partial [Suillus lakei]
MTTSVDATAARANAAFRSAADKVKHLLGQALQLKPADPKQITIAMEMASSLSYVFSSFAYLATSVLPMVLSAAAELHEYLDSSCNVVSTLVWSNIRAGDPCQSCAPKSKQQCATSKAMITSEDERNLDMTDIPKQPVARKKTSPTLRKTQLRNKSPLRLTVTSNDEDSWATVNPIPTTGPSYVELDELDEEMLMNIGLVPKMGRPYVEILPAPRAIAGDDAADPMVWSPGCGPCIHRGPVCCQGFNNSGAVLTVCGSCHHLKHKCSGNSSAAPTTKGKKPVVITTWWARSRSHCRASPVHVSPETDDTAAPAAAFTSGAPAPVVAAELLSAIAAPTPTPATAPITTPITAPIKAKASIGEKHLLEANQRLADQEATSKLLAEQFQELRRQLLPPQVPASPVTVCLPVMIGNSGNKDIAGAEDAAESTSGAIAEAEGAAESMSGAMAEAEEAAESVSGVIAGLSSNTMDVAKDPAESASVS